MYEDAPHSVTCYIKIGTYRYKTSNELVSVGKADDLIIPIDCKNLDQAKEFRIRLINEIKECTKKVQQEMFPKKK